ncbi:hypothetical protein ABZP36_035674 [Zizania latifolia]
MAAVRFPPASSPTPITLIYLPREKGLGLEKGSPLPKFGEWDVNDPASAEGFTVIFNKARDEKKTGGNSQEQDVPKKSEQPSGQGLYAAKGNSSVDCKKGPPALAQILSVTPFFESHSVTFRFSVSANMVDLA